MENEELSIEKPELRIEGATRLARLFSILAASILYSSRCISCPQLQRGISKPEPGFSPWVTWISQPQCPQRHRSPRLMPIGPLLLTRSDMERSRSGIGRDATYGTTVMRTLTAAHSYPFSSR